MKPFKYFIPIFCFTIFLRARKLLLKETFLGLYDPITQAVIDKA